MKKLDKFKNLSKAVAEAVTESEINKLHQESIKDFEDEPMTDEEFHDWIYRGQKHNVDQRKIDFNIEVEAGFNPSHKTYKI